MATSAVHTSIPVMTFNTMLPAPRWYVLYGRYASVNVIEELQYFKDNADDIIIDDFFVPVEIKKQIKDGNTITKKTLFTGQYIFLKAHKDSIVRLKHTPSFTTDIRFLHPRMGDTALITVTDREMQIFRNAVLAMNSEVEYFHPTAQELKEGDRVRVIGGLFDGIEGILEHKRGHSSNRIIVSVNSMLAVRTLSIEPENIQLLEFAKSPTPVSSSMKPDSRQHNTYKSRAYKEIKKLLTESQAILQTYNQQGILCEEEYLSAHKLYRRYSQLQLTGKLKEQHAEALQNLKDALEI